MDKPLDADVLVDSSVLIDFFGKRKKEKSVLFRLIDQHATLYLSVMTAFEVKAGITSERQQRDYDRLTAGMDVLPLDEACIDEAVAIYQDLKARNALIGLADLLMAATALRYDLAVATLNEKHFERVTSLEIVPL